ncbi:MAG: hypothetical protein RMJ88_13150 [Thermogemmata sp.]|nr:hypothetical protein [Thermogemmata sp.]
MTNTQDLVRHYLKLDYRPIPHGSEPFCRSAGWGVGGTTADGAGPPTGGGGQGRPASGTMGGRPLYPCCRFRQGPALMNYVEIARRYLTRRSYELNELNEQRGGGLVRLIRLFVPSPCGGLAAAVVSEPHGRPCRLVEQPAELPAALDAIRQANPIGLDIETTG